MLQPEGQKLRYFFPRNLPTPFLIPLFLGIVLLISTISGCETPPGAAPYEVSPEPFRSLTLIPEGLQFDPAQGIRDTTVTVDINVQLRDGQLPENPVFTVVRQGFPGTFREGSLNLNQDVSLTASFSFSTTTNSSFALTVYVFDQTDSGVLSNTLQRNFTQTGFTTQPPEILGFEHPPLVNIPTEGTVSFRFETEVFHPEGQENIELVLLELFDSKGNLLGGEPFSMLDDGDIENSGDLEAGDGIFTRAFFIGPENQPEVYDVRTYALDRQGLSSDTLTSTFIIE
ncbi:hypothetical protein CYPRO_1757 [Cyclonatronum proteinivorum]|uniref:Uncharacterized protein n=1 Tax=Cyclonatronum proteinivorum TaxID=1457365 RepID=A0A345UKK5_9BACT|nr:hypothetical protein [Cyclonatronum proteinivorum]AXJ01007.1 hypothetical protein CYPRO_1757 [Cyclonatronum proteinivorum]